MVHKIYCSLACVKCCCLDYNEQELKYIFCNFVKLYANINTNVIVFNSCFKNNLVEFLLL